MFLHGFTEKDCKISQPSFNSSQAGQDRQAGPVEQFSDRTVLYWVAHAANYMAHIRHYLHSFIHYVKIVSTDINVTMNSGLDIKVWYHMLFNTTFGEH